jgi:hypothetical protein
LSDEKPLLSAAIRHLADRQRRALTEHPTAAELTAYHAGELPPEAEARLREHLALCRDCSDLLLDLAGFATLTPPPGVPELTDAEVEQDWQALRARLGEAVKGEPRPAPVVPIRRIPRASHEPARLSFLALAASVLAVVGLSWGAFQTWRLHELSKPGVVPLISQEETKRSAGESGGYKVSSRVGGVVLLPFDADRSYPQHEVELVQNGKVLLRLPVEGEIGQVGLSIPPGFDPGPYEVHIYGIEGGRRELSSSLPLTIDVP